MARRVSFIPSIFAAVVVLFAGATLAGAALSVALPPGHEAVVVAPDPGYSQGFEVASTLDSDAGCQIQLQPAGNTGATQAQLNAIAATPAYEQVVKQLLEIRFDIATIAPYALGGVRGVQATGAAKGGAGMSVLATILQTPRGKIAVVCVGPSVAMGKLRPEFKAITRGVRPPS